MADEFRVELTADNQISDEARDAADALDRIPDEVETRLEVEASGIDKAIGKLDALAGEASSAAVAAEALGQALGPELTARADMRSVIAELEKLGVTADEVTADVDRVAAKLREIDSPDLGGGIGQALGTARGETEKLADSARGANSALANMIGNSAQELGAFGGLAGGAGVAIGQMGEYAADAALGGEKLSSALGSMAKVAGPIAGIALIIQGISSVMGAYRQQAAEAAEVEAFNVENAELFGTVARENLDLVDEYVNKAREQGAIEVAPNADQETAALEELANAGEGLYDVLQRMRDDGGIPDLGEQEILDITDLLDKAGTNAEEFYRAASDPSALRTFTDGIKSSNLTLGEQAQVLSGVYYQQEQYRTGAQDAAKDLRIFGEANDEVADKVDTVGISAEQVAEMLRQYALAAIEAQRELGALAGTFEQIGIRSDALSSIFDLGNAPLDAAGEIRDITIAIDGLSEAADGVSGDEIRLGAVDADPLLDSIDALRPDIQSKIIDAFSAGGPEAATAMANSYIDQVTAELGGRLTREEVAALLGLDNIEATVQVAIELSALENAKRQLDILTGVTGQTPYTASIALALDAGTITPEQALTLIQAQLAGAGVEIPSELAVPTTDAALAEANAALNAAPLSIPTTADLTGAEETVGGFVARAWEATVVGVEADPAPAEQQVDEFVSADRTTDAVEVDASTAAAAAIILAFLALPRKANIYADVPNAGAAMAVLEAIRSAPRTANIDVRAGTITLPTSADLAARIGPVRVPIDLYVRTSPRLDGG